jgi:hypothetical protein
MTLASRITDVIAAVRDKLNTITPRLPPAGGTTGQVLSKTSATDYATQWSTAGTVTTASVTTANGVSGTVATSTTTPAITLMLGAITPSSVAATGTVTGSNLSGTNTGDQSTITGNAGTATKFATARNINGVAFDGTAAITVNAVDATARAPTTRLINTTAPLTGGGDLSADRTLAVSTFSTTVAGVVPASTTADAKRLHADATWSDELAAICFIVDGGGATITAGIKGDLTVPFACTIVDWTILSDQSGSIVVNLWKSTLAAFPPTVTAKITASLPPTVTSTTKANSTTLTGWTTTVSAGDVIRFNVDSVTTIQRATITLKVKKA